MEYLELIELTEEKAVYRYYPEGKEKWGIVSINRKTGNVFHDKHYDENDHTEMYHGMAWSRLRKYQAADNYPKKAQIAWY